jgi:hypothetical protein
MRASGVRCGAAYGRRLRRGSRCPGELAGDLAARGRHRRAGTARHGRSTGRLRRSTVGLRPSTAGLRRSTARLRPSTARLRPSTAGLRPSTTGLRPSTAGLRPSTAEPRRSTAGLRPSTPELRRSTGRLRPGTTTSTYARAAASPRLLWVLRAEGASSQGFLCDRTALHSRAPTGKGGDVAQNRAAFLMPDERDKPPKMQTSKDVCSLLAPSGPERAPLRFLAASGKPAPPYLHSGTPVVCGVQVNPVHGVAPVQHGWL